MKTSKGCITRGDMNMSTTRRAERLSWMKARPTAAGKKDRDDVSTAEIIGDKGRDELVNVCVAVSLWLAAHAD